MKKLYLITGILLIFLGLILSLAVPIPGILAILFGIFIIRKRRKLK